MSTWSVYAALTLTVTFWGTSFIATKIALRELSPATITFIRFAMGILVLIVLVRSRKAFRSISRREAGWLTLLGFLGITLHQWLQATGLETASATVTAWIVATIPIFIALLGWAILGERLGKMHLGGILLALVGVLFVVSHGDPRALIAGRIGTAGDTLIVLSAANWAIFTVLSKRVLGGNSSIQSEIQVSLDRTILLLLYVMTLGWIFTFPWLALDGGWKALPEISIQVWLALIFLGVCCSGLAYYLWYYALDSFTATRVGVFLYFQPLVTTFLAGPMLGEKFGAISALGGGAILLGVWLVNRG